MESEEVDFLFDIVVTRVELFNPDNDPDKFDAVVKFAGNSVTVTKSRINVSEFENNRQFPFSTSPKSLRNALETNGLAVSLRYNKSEMGSGVIEFPEEFIDKIGPTMHDLFHQDTLSLKRNDEAIGKLSLLLVLIVKCAEREQNQDESSKKSSSPKEEKVECSGLATTVNPQDMLFVIGDPDPLLNIPDKPCSDLPSEEGEERLRLDLQRYRSMHNRRVKFPHDDPCPKLKPSFSQLKKLTKEYSQIIDSVAEKVRRVGEPSAMARAESPFNKTTVTPKTPHEVTEERWLPVPIGSEEQHGVKPTRFCPVCLNSMSWLPKYAPCPKCNTKPRPVLEKMKMTADEIVAEQLVRPTAPIGAKGFCLPPCKAVSRRFMKMAIVSEEPMVDSDSDAECPPCRCTCADRKLCAHCRIRRLCMDVFENEAPKEQRPDPYRQPRSSEDFCLIPGPENDDRPYLSRVFSEMKNLYALHDSKKIEAMRLRCESQTLLRNISSGRSTYDMRPSQQAMAGNHIPGTFDRQRAGHKNCLPADCQVPRRHGWNWPISRQARKYGWRPGAILRAAEHVMRFFLSSREESDPYSKIIAEQEEQQQQSTPTLNICKRDGAIFVTLRPLANQRNRQKPITFRIVKSQLAVALRQIKRSLKDQGFEKCRCHKSLMLCTCRDALEKFELNKALRKECRRRLMEPCPDHLVLTDTSVSDLEFNLDVSPPARNSMSQVKALRNTMNHGTQTSQKEELPMPPQYTKEVPPYYRAFDCALGDRYMGTAFGRPGEQVFEDGVFGMDGGGPHGPNPMPCGRRQGASGPVGIGGRGVNGSGAWKGFPGGKGTVQKGGQSKPIPVRYPKRLLKPGQDAANAAKQAEMDAANKKKKGTDMIKYLQQKGVMRRPWNANEGKDTRTMPVKK